MQLTCALILFWFWFWFWFWRWQIGLVMLGRMEANDLSIHCALRFRPKLAFPVSLPHHSRFGLTQEEGARLPVRRPAGIFN